MNNLAMENSNTNAGDLLIRAWRGMKTNRERIGEATCERKKLNKKSVPQWENTSFVS